MEWDKVTRLFSLPRRYETGAIYSEDAQQIAKHFVTGINAYIDWLEQHPERMPFEFKKLNYKPARLASEDVVRIRSHGLTGNLHDEVARAKMACVSDLKSDEVRSGSNRH